MFSALQSTSRPLTAGANVRQIDAYLATLSVFKVVKKLTKNAVLNMSLCCSTDAAEKNCNTATIHHVHKCPKDVLENLLPVWLLVRTNLFIPSRFWTTDTKFDTCCQRYVATCGKNLYRCTSTVSALNYCSRIFFFENRQLSIRSGAHKLFRRFLDFSQFLNAI